MVLKRWLGTNLGSFAIGLAAFGLIYGILWLLLAANLILCKPLAFACGCTACLSLPPFFIYRRKPRLEITPSFDIKETTGTRPNDRLLAGALGSLASTLILGSVVWLLLQDRIAGGN